MRKGRGFSLIELVIVVVIIGIISLLTYPSMTDSLSEARLYRSTRAVAETLTFARIQAIMRNQAHEVTVRLSPNQAGGTVEVRRYASTRCSNPENTIIQTTRLAPFTGITEVRNEANVGIDMTKICFRPNGRAADGANGAPMTGELRLVMRRFHGAEGGDGEVPVSWPLYVRINNMGLVSLAKVVELPDGAGG